MNNIRNVESINDAELNAGIIGGLSAGSWHEEYKDSAWVFLGGFSYELSEGDIICVMSQWGEIEDINLVRDKATNKSKGFAFIKYEDHRSCILAVDNFNGMKLLGRTLRCDHVEEYRLPKEVREKEMEALENDPEARVDIGPGHAYKNTELATEHDVNRGVDLWRQPKSAEPAREPSNADDDGELKQKKHKKDKKDKNEQKEKKHKHEKKEKHERHEKDEKKPERHARDDDDRQVRNGKTGELESTERTESRPEEHLRDSRDRRDRHDRDRSRSRDRGDRSRDGDRRSDGGSRRRADSRDRGHSRDRDRDRQGRRDRSPERRRDDSRDRRSRERGTDRDRDREDRRPAGTSVPSAASAAPNTTSTAISGRTAAPFTSNSAGAAPFATGAVASWRGNRDPSASTAPVYATAGGVLGKRPLDSKAAPAPGAVPKRDQAPSGIAGASRVR